MENKVWSFAEEEYRFGVGRLRMTIERVDWSAPLMYGGEPWYEVRGVEMAADGRRIGPRRTTVRGARLRPHGEHPV